MHGKQGVCSTEVGVAADIPPEISPFLPQRVHATWVPVLLFYMVVQGSLHQARPFVLLSTEMDLGYVFVPFN